MPAALPSILTGLKIGWAFAWRTLIAAELVFGVSSGQGGLGWYIFESKNPLDIAEVFAGLLDRHPDRARGREHDFPLHREADRTALGHADLKFALQAGLLCAARRWPKCAGGLIIRD